MTVLVTVQEIGDTVMTFYSAFCIGAGDRTDLSALLASVDNAALNVMRDQRRASVDALMQKLFLLPDSEKKTVCDEADHWDLALLFDRLEAGMYASERLRNRFGDRPVEIPSEYPLASREQNLMCFTIRYVLMFHRDRGGRHAA